MDQRVTMRGIRYLSCGYFLVSPALKSKEKPADLKNRGFLCIFASRIHLRNQSYPDPGRRGGFGSVDRCELPHRR
ncbi:hypothetical protein SAMN05518855_1020117 [Paenibacillus sp. CF384]|nr:hypothetical protein SAMN05518855_1020117 [Paenibacillus sp. CF384]